MKTISVALLSVAFVSLAQHVCTAHEGHDHFDPGDGCAAVAYAVPLKNITVDGKLDDWPSDTIKYPLLNNWDPYGPTDIIGQSLRDNPDLSGYFMVGYEPKQELLYVAFVVRDESLVTMNNDKDHLGWETDVTELYTDGLHAERQSPWAERQGLANRASVQYIGTTGDGGAYHCKWMNPGKHNPWANDVPPAESGATVVALRANDQIIYEWSLRVYDMYPQRSPLVDGRRIGFDAVMVDMDEHDGKMTDRAAWVPFGKRGYAKFHDARSMADLVFIGDRKSMGTIAGKVDGLDAKSAELAVEAWNDSGPAGEAFTDPAGAFTMTLPAGHYKLRPRPGQNLGNFVQDIEVKRGKTVKLTLHPADPPEIHQWPGNGHFYSKIDQSMTWQAALEFAARYESTRNGAVLSNWHLATITSDKENAFVFETVMGESPDATKKERDEAPFYWLGGVQFGDGIKDFVWVTGEPTNYQRFVDAELLPREKALLIGGYTGDKWNDGDGPWWSERQRFILEHNGVK